MRNKVLLILIAVLTLNSHAQEKKEDSIEFLPVLEEGYSRVIVELPEIKGKEQLYQVELFAGKEMGTDRCNTYALIGDFSEETMEEMGHKYFYVRTQGQVVKSMKDCPEGETKKQFVYFASHLVPYSSKAPIVVCVPKGFDIRYRIWQTDDHKISVEKLSGGEHTREKE